MDWIDQLIQEGTKTVDEVEIYYGEGTSVSADLKKRTVHLATNSMDCGLGIRVIHHGQIGSSSTSNPGQWRECLAAAIASSKLATPQPWEGLPAPEPLPEVPVSFDSSMKIEPECARDLLSRMLEGADAHKADITSGSAGLSRVDITLANSNGVRYTDRHTGVSLSLEAIHKQSTGYEFDSAWSISMVDPAAVGERATFFARNSSEGEEIATGEYDLLLSPLAYAELLGGVFVPALSGRNVHAKRSRLGESLGKCVASEQVSMYDDPHMPGPGGSVGWDAEGMPTRRIDFVRDGVLQCFAYDLKTAYRHGQESTGSAVRGGSNGLPAIGHHNFVVDGIRNSVDDTRVLYVHNLIGAHTANPLSGDFSVELSNVFWMENGELQKPVRSAMFSGNVFELHHNIAGLSRKSRTVGSLVLPSIKINNQRIIGKN
ncbi:TldD/PmbA family protein [uncultured Methanoregula sp.]|uniref:TldD/PmbA family protein n=1 Tax=uncultured Methanoregula sp. TaxID=1005933 RepID=UPI002AABF7F2|nr:TldD/PmbA family protein [uncultured Methanoregula sp.]